MAQGKIWFKAKQYGWGWYPATWQGWLVLLVYAALDTFAITQLVKADVTDVVLASSLLLVVASTLGLILLCYKKGEAPKWRWGKKN